MTKSVSAAAALATPTPSLISASGTLAQRLVESLEVSVQVGDRRRSDPPAALTQSRNVAGLAPSAEPAVSETTRARRQGRLGVVILEGGPRGLAEISPRRHRAPRPWRGAAHVDRRSVPSVLPVASSTRGRR